jgi:molybdenum cofactor synthesis domain-containing protein
MTDVTAGVIIIGNELLSGQTQDKNLPYIIEHLAPLGIHVQEAIIIPDLKATIIKTVRDYSSRFTYVFTTGGIGPTHDDITPECIAEAFHRPHVPHPEAHKILQQKYCDSDLNESRLRMAIMPEGAEVILDKSTQSLGFRLNNVYVMAGIPRIMHGMLESVLPTLKSGRKWFKKFIACTIAEGQIAAALRQLQDQYPKVEIGSYPHWIEGKPCSLRLSVRSFDASTTNQVAEEILTICKTYDANVTLIEG